MRSDKRWITPWARKSLMLLGVAIPASFVCAEEPDRDIPRAGVTVGPDGVRVEASLGYVPAPPEVVAGYEQDLGNDGRWVNIVAYGRCWVPNNRREGWRPYTVGHWAATDEGWTWVAEEDETAWGDTCYHYGRWTLDPDNGWVWVPGTVWSPAWVAWREGDDVSAWAPLPPECGDGVLVTPEVADEYIPAERYVSVDERFISEPAVYRHVEVNNVTIINRTTNITRITYSGNRAVNPGVSIEHVEKRVGHAVQRVQAVQVASHDEARRLLKEGKPVHYVPAAVEKHIKAHPVQARVAPHRQPAAQPAAHRVPGKPEPRAHEEIKPQPHERNDVKPKPGEREETKPQPRAHEEPKGPAHTEGKPKPAHEPVKKPEERRNEEK